MRISELSRASGVPVATIKYYLREKLLPAGRVTAPTQARYDERHVRRLALVRALVEVAGLSLADVRAVVISLENPPGSWHEVLGVAHGALPPSAADPPPGPPERALDAVARLGWRVDPRTPALAQLELALAAVAAVGVPMSAKTLEAYGSAAAEVARVDVAGVPTSSPEDAARYVVLGTVLYEPVLLALRRLAQVDASARRFAAAADEG